jgi:hypothetical protein
MLYSEVSKEIPISRDDYEKSLKGWTVEPITKYCELIGVVISKNREIHMCIKKQKALKHARWIIRCYLSVKLQELGFLETKSLDENDAFLDRLGFYKIGSDGKLTVYRLDNLKIS